MARSSEHPCRYQRFRHMPILDGHSDTSRKSTQTGQMPEVSMYFRLRIPWQCNAFTRGGRRFLSPAWTKLRERDYWITLCLSFHPSFHPSFRPYGLNNLIIREGSKSYKSSNGQCCHHKHYPSTTIFKGGGHLELRGRIFFQLICFIHHCFSSQCASLSQHRYLSTKYMVSVPTAWLASYQVALVRQITSNNDNHGDLGIPVRNLFLFPFTM